jgi:hypothetical protein
MWKLEDHLARVRSESFEASINLLRPMDGLGQFRIAGTPLGQLQLLGVQLPVGTSVDPGNVLERFVRGWDIAVAYGGWGSWPIRLDVLWRVTATTESNQQQATIDCVISVRTELLDTRPEMAVTGSLPACRILRLTGQDSGSFTELGIPDSLVLDRRDSPSCLLFRIADSPVSYLEMVHPADVGHDELSLKSGSSQLQVRHTLFPFQLEKGVIFRARVRGVLFSSSDDLSVAGGLYRKFVTADPPLSE